jgi:hypothetical protein
MGMSSTVVRREIGSIDVLGAIGALEFRSAEGSLCHGQPIFLKTSRSCSPFSTRKALQTIMLYRGLHVQERPS